MKTSAREDQYGIIFYVAVWPERPYEVDFFEKSSQFGGLKFVRNGLKKTKNGPNWTSRHHFGH